MLDPNRSLQDQYAPNLVCFGCGPANPQGLQLKSFIDGQQIRAKFRPGLYHEAFPGVLNGGIIGTLLDCHCNWMACYHLMLKSDLASPPCTVTAEYKIELLKPTPSSEFLELQAWVVESSNRKAVTEGTISASGVVTAKCRGIFVSVREDHPAYHRW